MEGFSSSSNFNEYPKVKITVENIKKAINKNKWIFAKTMPHNPHWYSLRKQWNNSIVKFEDLVPQCLRKKSKSKTRMHKILWNKMFYMWF